MRTSISRVAQALPMQKTGFFFFTTQNNTAMKQKKKKQQKNPNKQQKTPTQSYCPDRFSGDEIRCY